MITDRMYEWTMNVEQPCKFLSSDSNVKDRLDKVFTKTCYYGSLILEVTKINKTSMCRIITSNHLAHGAINVCFTARVMIYRKGDIIPDVRIQIIDGQIVGVSEYATITLEKSANNKVLTNGQTIPVIVGDKILYNTNSNTVNVLGSILVPVTKNPVYHIKGQLDSKLYNTVSNLVDDLKSQDKPLKDDKSKHFIDLLNPKAKSTAKKGGAAALESTVNIVEILEKAKNKTIDIDGYWTKEPNQSADGLKFVIYKDAPSEEYINLTPIMAINEMLYQCYAIRDGIIKLGQSYDAEKMEQASNIWALMKKNKN